MNNSLIKGYDKLAQYEQEVFDKTYAAYKRACEQPMTPIRVKRMANYLRVDFEEGEWLHFRAGGTWD